MFSKLSDCQSGANATAMGTVAVTAGKVKDSNVYKATTPGGYFWQAIYSGDAYNGPATGACTDEPLNVVDSYITISPLEGTEIVGATHVLTGQVFVNTGDGAGYIAATDGTTVTFTLLGGSVGSFTAGSTCTTVSGSCKISTTSTVTGKDTVQASGTSLVKGLSLVRTTGQPTTGHPNSANAIVRWTTTAAPRISIQKGPSSQSVSAGGKANFTITVTNTGNVTLTNVTVKDPDLVRPDAPGLVQEFATGDRETIKLFRSSGNTIARFAMIVDRCWPPLGGSSTMRRVVTPPEDSLRHAERLVSEIGLDGYSEVEFRRNAQGLPLLMEINPRLSQSVEVATRAGFDFPRMQLEWARGGRIPAAPSRTPVGLRVGWLGGDLRLLLGALGGAPAPRPKLVPTVTAIARDYLLRRARLEGLNAHDRKPIVRAFALPVTGRRRARPSG